jgi:hypothetical protein
MAAGYLNANPSALPGISAALVSAIRELLCVEPQAGDMLPFSATIDGTLTRDPDNPTTSRSDVLRDGLPMGQVTSTLKYANAIIGQLSAACATGATTLTCLTTAEAAEIVRRIGASGTLNLTGPATAGGAVRTILTTFSAVGSGSAVNCVQTITWNSAPSAGTFTITVLQKDGVTYKTTTAIAYGATLPTVQTALDVATGVANGCVVTGTTYAYQTMIFTFSGTGYAALPQQLISIDDTSLTYTTPTGYVATMTTVGVPVAGTITITANGVNEVQTVGFAGITAGTLTAGTFALGILDKNGVWQKFLTVYSSSAATLQAQLDAVLGASAVVVAVTTGGTIAGGFTLTFSGTGYAGLPQTLAVIDPAATALVSGAVSPSISVTRTTAAVNGAFVAGSWIQPTDGSQAIKTLFKSPSKTGVSDLNALLQGIDVIYPEVLLRGFVRTAYIVNYPGDGSTFNAYLKNQLRANSGGFWQFDDDYISTM